MDEPESNGTEWVREALREFEGPLLRYAAHITGDVELARDVVQDTFMRLCAVDSASVNGHLAAWLFAVCRNRALDVRRRQRRLTSLDGIEFEVGPSHEASPAMLAVKSETNSEISRVVATLSRNQQEVIRLKFQEGMSYEEISRIANLSVSNVGFLMHTAIKTIRQRLKSEAAKADRAFANDL